MDPVEVNYPAPHRYLAQELVAVCPLGGEEVEILAAGADLEGDPTRHDRDIRVAGRAVSTGRARAEQIRRIGRPPRPGSRGTRRLVDPRAQAHREAQVRRHEDGNAAAERFVQAGHEYIATMANAQQVIANMAATFRAAGRTVTEADEAGRQMFRGKPE
jgi:hypothetical protein